MLFELEGVTAARSGTPVLRDLTLAIPPGVTCVAGPSGSGKSTLLRLLCRLADPESGTVRYGGEDVRARDVLELRRQVCLVPQLPALREGSVADNLRYAAALAGRQVDVARLLGLAGLDPALAERAARRLSVGEQQRAMLARALAVAPAVLLLDEPTSALDEESQTAVELTLLDLRERLGISMVLVTHDIGQAARMADRVLRLEAGRIANAEPAPS